MKYLLDTHILLWSFTSREKISPIANLLEDPHNTIYFSSASIWEIAIKHTIGKLDISPDQAMHYAELQSYTELPITAKHAANIISLRYPEDKPPHKDPFDNILISQAKSAGMMLITADSKIMRYQEPCIMAL